MKVTLSYILLFLMLGIYLLVPFKPQFLNSLHFLSHVYQHENPHHHHNRAFNSHGHQHGFIEKISHALEDSQADHPLPSLLSGFEFQPVFPAKREQSPEVFPVLLNKIHSYAATFLLTGPYFEVPTPPP